MNLYQMRCRKKLEMEAKDMPSYPDSESIKVIDGSSEARLVDEEKIKDS